jgi:hypothetical protein
LLFLTLLVVLEAFGKVLVDGEIDGLIVASRSIVVVVVVVVEEFSALGGRLSGSLAFHFARHVGQISVVGR